MLNQNIVALFLSLLNLYGSNLFSKNYVFPLLLQLFGVITKVRAARLANKPAFHSRAKHIEIDLHFIREKVLRNKLVIKYVPSLDQIADILTKHLSTTRFCNLHIKLFVISFPMSFRGDDNHLTSNETSHNRSTKHPTNSVSVTTIQTDSEGSRPGLTS